MEQITKILLVEDNPADADLVREILDEQFVGNLVVVENGEDAMSYLSQDLSLKAPDLILLDLNLPRKDGRAVLREIKLNPLLKNTPVIILTSSEAEEDIVKSYDLNANCYVKKPVDYHTSVIMLKTLRDFWLNIVKLPTKE